MALHLHTALCEQLGIHYPIVQAGMAGGPTTAALVAAVSEAGGLGTLGAAYMEPKAIRETIREIRRLTNRPFAVNLFAVSMEDDLSRIDEVQRMLHSLREQLGISQGALHFQHRILFPSSFRSYWKNRCRSLAQHLVYSMTRPCGWLNKRSGL